MSTRRWRPPTETRLQRPEERETEMGLAGDRWAGRCPQGLLHINRTCSNGLIAKMITSGGPGASESHSSSGFLDEFDLVQPLRHRPSFYYSIHPLISTPVDHLKRTKGSSIGLACQGLHLVTFFSCGRMKASMTPSSNQGLECTWCNQNVTKAAESGTVFHTFGVSSVWQVLLFVTRVGTVRPTG